MYNVRDQTQVSLHPELLFYAVYAVCVTYCVAHKPRSRKFPDFMFSLAALCVWSRRYRHLGLIVHFFLTTKEVLSPPYLHICIFALKINRKYGMMASKSM